MNIHEYQARELLQKFDVATTRGKVASTADEAEQIASELGDVDLVVKAQIHAGGRGKGTFKNGFEGGVHLSKSPAHAREIASKMLGQTLVTHQTGSAGRVVNKVLVAESAEIAREIYFAILPLSRAQKAELKLKPSLRNLLREFFANQSIRLLVSNYFRHGNWRNNFISSHRS